MGLTFMNVIVFCCVMSCSVLDM